MLLQPHDVRAGLSGKLTRIAIALGPVNNQLRLFLLHLLSERDQVIRRWLNARFKFDHADLLQAEAIGKIAPLYVIGDDSGPF